MSSIKIMRPEDICPNCTSYQQEIAALKKALVEARDEFSYQYRQYEDEISELDEEVRQPESNNKDVPFEYCAEWAEYQKEIAELEEGFIEGDDESVCRYLQYIIQCVIEDKILELKAEIKKLKAEHSSGSQSKKKVLEEVRQPESNTTLRALSSFKGEENEHWI